MNNTSEEHCRAEVESMMQDLIRAGIPNDTLLDMVLEIREEANGDPTEILRKVRQLHEPVVEMNRLTDVMIKAGADPKKISEKIKQIQEVARDDHVQLMNGMRELHRRVMEHANKNF